MPNPIANALASVTVGTPITRGNLTMIPVIGPPAVEREPFYLTLDEAIGQGWTETTEVTERRSVPELRIINKGAKPVLVLDGEELPGAAPNRILNLSILVPAASTVLIPLPAAEAARWRAKSPTFETAPCAQYSAGRAQRMALVTLSMQLNKYSAGQADVWAGISASGERLGAITERCVEELRPVERQCGALFMIDGRVLGFDLFDNAATLRRLLPKLVRSIAFDALNRSGGPTEDVDSESIRRSPARFLAQVAAAPVHAAKAIGEGEDIRIRHPDLAGGALAANCGAVHVAAFAV